MFFVSKIVQNNLLSQTIDKMNQNYSMTNQISK